jgi:hypothetical protein
MISRYILFDITSGLPTAITTSIDTYEEYMVYGSSVAVGVDETDLTEDALIMITWHWTGDAVGIHTEQPGNYWVWDITTWSYIFIAPAPVINVGAYSTYSEYRKITIYGSAADAQWLTTSFPIQLRTNTVDNFATATILTEDMASGYVEDNTEVTSRYYYLTPYYLDDYYTPVYGATVSTGSVIPLAVETGDIGLSAVNSSHINNTDKLILNTTQEWTDVQDVNSTRPANNATVGANLLNTYTIPAGTIPASLTLTTGTSAVTYTAGSGTLTKTGTLLGWYASGYSTNSFTGGAQVSFTTVAPTTGRYMVGLNIDPATDAIYTTLDYAIYLSGLNQHIYESNVHITRPGANNAFVAGDTFSVIYNGANLVNYYRNGILFYSTYVKTPITAPLYMDSSFYHTDMRCTNLRFNAYSAPVLLSGNNLSGVIHAGNAVDHLSDNIISTATVQPRSISDFQSSVFSIDTSFAVTDLTLQTVTLFCGVVTVTGDKFSKVLILMGLSNLSKTLTSFPVPVSISVQSKSNIHSTFNPPALSDAFYIQAATPTCTATNYESYQKWYKVSATGGADDISYPVSQLYAPAVTRQLNVIPTVAGVNTLTDVFTCTIYPVWATSISTGMQVVYYNVGTGVNIAPLISGTYYYIIAVSATTFKLATTLANATAGVAINITAVSTGTVAHIFMGGFRWLLQRPGSYFNIGYHEVIANSEVKSTSVMDSGFFGDRTEDTFYMYAEFTLPNVTSALAFDTITFDATLAVIVGKR